MASQVFKHTDTRRVGPLLVWEWTLKQPKAASCLHKFEDASTTKLFRSPDCVCVCYMLSCLSGWNPLHGALEARGHWLQGSYPSRGLQWTYPYPAQSGIRTGELLHLRADPSANSAIGATSEVQTMCIYIYIYICMNICIERERD